MFAKLFLINRNFETTVTTETLERTIKFLFTPSSTIIHKSKAITQNQQYLGVQIRAYNIPLNSHKPELMKDIGWVQDRDTLVKFIYSSMYIATKSYKKTIYLSTDNPGVVEEFRAKNYSIIMNKHGPKHRHGFESDVGAIVDSWSLSKAQRLLLTQHSTFGTLAYIYSKRIDTYIFSNSHKHYIYTKNPTCLHLINNDTLKTIRDYNCLSPKGQFLIHKYFYNEYMGHC